MPRTQSAPQITSKGCSRGFILCVLYRALDYVRQRQMLGHTVQFPFCNEEICRWLQAAQGDCSISEPAYQDGLGGTYYDEADTSTFWTQPQQFCTWWKNNVERKNKFLLLQRDAAYNSHDEKQIARAAYCRNAIAITLSIKNNFHRYLPSQGDANIVQYIIPYPMPAHMVRASSLTDIATLTAERCSTPSFTSCGSPRVNGNPALSASPVVTPRVKRTYNKKKPRVLLCNLAPEASSVSQDTRPTQSPPVPTLNTHYLLDQPHPSSPPVSDRASADSGTDDESIYRVECAHMFSNGFEDGFKGSRKRKALPMSRRPSAYDVKSTNASVPTGSPSFEATSFSMPTDQMLLPATVSSYSLASPRLPVSYTSASALPSYESGIPFGRPRAVSDADLMFQQYCSIENQAPHRPETSQNDQVCCSLKLSEQPYMESVDDYFNSDLDLSASSEDCYYSDCKPRSVVVSPVATSHTVFRPIGATDVKSFKSTRRNCTPPPVPDFSPIHADVTPRQTPTVLTIPPLHLCDRTSLNRDVYEVPSYPAQKEASKMYKGITLGSSPFFSVTRRFEDDLLSLLQQGPHFDQIITNDNNRILNGNFFSSSRSYDNEETGLRSIDLASSDNTYQHNQHNISNHSIITSTSSCVSPSVPSIPSTCSSARTTLGDFSLMEDGEYEDDGDLLSFFGLRNSKWTIDDFDETLVGEDWFKGPDKK